MGAAEAGEQARVVDVPGGQQWSDPDASAQDTAQLVDLLANAVHLGFDAVGAGGDELAGLGGDNGAAGAFEQGGAQFALELADLLRECGLANVLLVRGAGEVPQPDNRFHARRVAKVHDPS
jgi:hypothetical protein